VHTEVYLGLAVDSHIYILVAVYVGGVTNSRAKLTASTSLCAFPPSYIRQGISEDGTIRGLGSRDVSVPHPLHGSEFCRRSLFFLSLAWPFLFEHAPECVRGENRALVVSRGYALA